MFVGVDVEFQFHCDHVVCHCPSSYVVVVVGVRLGRTVMVVKGSTMVLRKDELDVGVGETVGDEGELVIDAEVVLRRVDVDV